MKMMFTASLGALALVAPSPSFAQDGTVDPDSAEVASEPKDAEDALKLLGSMFKAEPLNEEQRARLPLASRVVEKIMPEGALQEMMGSMFDGFLEPLMAMGKPTAKSSAAKLLGLKMFDLDIDDEQAAQIAQMIDPAWQERERREIAMIPEMTAALMSAMEPAMRKAMAEAYAVTFTDSELGDIAAFFDTESGASYARKSYQLASDPRILSATMQAFPKSIEALKGFKEKVEKANADLPPKRGFGELSAKERAMLVEVTGLSAEELEVKMTEAAKKNAFDF